ncbi:citrate/tricarballylate utilization protein [Poseidonocella pacifica]|uniref:Citrate/tricarballylate utilization protein n=1 Tax=Poseidonocella pacifica TaxID=871651 RepID=A0A1I0YL27_9RHOB|nr:tricarballylate utilization 4Fe-4S protein TcuB [Poseidonocella pacifica]SFB12863.1 citrate/tricarballylate utilization protein [Poseidonocella pacifica]
MQTDFLGEARRQAEICNACRYCEGYCAVFPALHRERAFSDGDLTQLANLCHNCRGCYYACQYTAPHEFDLNLPRALAEVRQESWKRHAWPNGFAGVFDRSGLLIAVGLVVGFALLFSLARGLRPEEGEGFYAVMSHGMMVAIFAPAFVLPLLALAASLRSYWREVGGGPLRLRDLLAATRSAGRMRNLEGGHGDGCNFEDEGRFTHARRHLHQAVLYGFLLCFASTASGTILHYVFGMEAPYGLFSLPKLLGVPGGILLSIGTAGLAWLKTRADRDLSAPAAWGGEMAFVLLLFTVGSSGLLLYAATGTGHVGWLLPLHLGAVLTFFVLTPYSKMAHGFYRMTALTREAAARDGGQV